MMIAVVAGAIYSKCHVQALGFVPGGHCANVVVGGSSDGNGPFKSVSVFNIFR
jgi:hypothetical protein